MNGRPTVNAIMFAQKRNSNIKPIHTQLYTTEIKIKEQNISKDSPASFFTKWTIAIWILQRFIARKQNCINFMIEFVVTKSLFFKDKVPCTLHIVLQPRFSSYQKLCSKNFMLGHKMLMRSMVGSKGGRNQEVDLGYLRIGLLTRSVDSIGR